MTACDLNRKLFFYVTGTRGLFCFLKKNYFFKK